MSNPQESLVEFLKRAASRLREVGLPIELATRLEDLAGQVRQPCTVAVVGRVKVGKSTFVNALLGEDLAKVGTTETTATINYFAYGEPDPERPVRCHWRGGKVTEEAREFLDGLQGNDLETLRRADGVDHLEYLLPNFFLKQITLVDTPGTGAVVEEHQDRTAEFMRLNGRLRDRHDQETRRLNETADAIIYLVGPVARATDEAFLEEFTRITGGGSSAVNAIGVMSKIELQPEVLERRHELSAKIAEQLKGSLNTVIPVAAGARRELDKLLEDDRTGLARLASTLRRIPPDQLGMLLDSQELFCELDFGDGPVGPGERRELLGDTKWGVFTTIARIAADPALSFDEVEERLSELCGFEPLWETIDERFVQRGHILRCYRIVRDAQEVLKELRFTRLPQRRREIRKNADLREKFLAFIRRADGDPATAQELEDFVCLYLSVDEQLAELEELYVDLDGDLSVLLHELTEYNADFEVLQRLEESEHVLSDAELEELRPLLGMYGVEIEKRLSPGKMDVGYVGARQGYWGSKRLQAPYGTVRYLVADRAYTRYGVILAELLDHPR